MARRIIETFEPVTNVKDLLNVLTSLIHVLTSLIEDRLDDVHVGDRSLEEGWLELEVDWAKIRLQIIDKNTVIDRRQQGRAEYWLTSEEAAIINRMRAAPDLPATSVN